MGRPPFEYTEDLADEICTKIATSEKGLHLLCKENTCWPKTTTIHEWLIKHKEFAEKYARARELQAEYLADQIIEIADDSSGDVDYDQNGNERENKEFVNRSKLRVDARKWKAARLAPKKWGDKLEVDQKVSGSIVWQEVRTYDSDKKTD